MANICLINRLKELSYFNNLETISLDVVLRGEDGVNGPATVILELKSGKPLTELAPALTSLRVSCGLMYDCADPENSIHRALDTLFNLLSDKTSTSLPSNDIKTVMKDPAVDEISMLNLSKADKPVQKEEIPEKKMAPLPPASKQESTTTNFPFSFPPDATGPTKTKEQSVPDPPPSTKGKGEIKDVQKLAIQGIMKLMGKSYKVLLEEAFKASGKATDPLPELDDLSYQDAIDIIRYGNSLKQANKK